MLPGYFFSPGTMLPGYTVARVHWYTVANIMLSLCQPYGPSITCLCDQDTSVLRCFLTEEEGADMQYLAQCGGGEECEV